MASLIDWSVAERTARALAAAPPSVTPEEAAKTVTHLRRSTEQAAAHVADLTKLHEPEVTAVTSVVDRPGWIAANTASMSTVMDPLAERIMNASTGGAPTKVRAA